MADKAEWQRTIDHMKKRRLELLKALSDLYYLFTETLNAERVTTFSQLEMLEIIISDCFNIYNIVSRNITVNLSSFFSSIMSEDNLSSIGKNLASSRLFFF